MIDFYVRFVDFDITKCQLQCEHGSCDLDGDCTCDSGFQGTWCNEGENSEEMNLFYFCDFAFLFRFRNVNQCKGREEVP